MTLEKNVHFKLGEIESAVKILVKQHEAQQTDAARKHEELKAAIARAANDHAQVTKEMDTRVQSLEDTRIAHTTERRTLWTLVASVPVLSAIISWVTTIVSNNHTSP